ncbi:MAG TPA: DUF2306 domain-containing protein [Amycolatopsis sp.]|jgi:hypothetical protein
MSQVLPDSPAGNRPPAPKTAKPWWRRPWFIPLVLGAFLVWKLPGWLNFDPDHTPVPMDPGFPQNYATIVAHIAFGTVTFVTACLQLWPWLRRRSPRAHRISGRLYVFAGFLPSVLLAIPLVAISALDLFGKLGSDIWIGLSLGTTVMGYVRARQRRYAAHRTWMVLSFALAANVITSRVFTYGVFSIPGIGPHIVSFTNAELESAWLSWMINLGIALWWLRRPARLRRKRLAAAQRSTPAGLAGNAPPAGG